MSLNLDRTVLPRPGRCRGRRRGTVRLRRPVDARPEPRSTTVADIDFSGVKPAASIDFWSNHPGKSQDVEKSHHREVPRQVPGHQGQPRHGRGQLRGNRPEVPDRAGRQVGLPSPRGPLRRLVVPLLPERAASSRSTRLVKQLDVKLDDFRSSLVDDYKYDDKQWALPYGRSTPLFYYNKDHFKAAGLPDRAPTTWQEFAEWAPKLKASFRRPVRLHATRPWPATRAGPCRTTCGAGAAAGPRSGTSPAIPPSPSRRCSAAQDSVYKDGWAGVSSKESADDFAAGITSATMSSTGSLIGVLKSAKFNVGVGFLPGGPKSDSGVCPTGGAGLGIPSGVTKEEQLAAATFLKFMTEPENTAAFSAATGYMPTRTSADMTAVLAKTPQIKTAMDQLAVTRVQDNARVFLPGADQEMAKAAAQDPHPAGRRQGHHDRAQGDARGHLHQGREAEAEEPDARRHAHAQIPAATVFRAVMRRALSRPQVHWRASG